MATYGALRAQPFVKIGVGGGHVTPVPYGVDSTDHAVTYYTALHLQPTHKPELTSKNDLNS